MERRVRRRVLPSVLTRVAADPRREPLREMNGGVAEAAGETRGMAPGDRWVLHGEENTPGAFPPGWITGGGENASDFGLSRGESEPDEDMLLCPEVLEEVQAISRRYALQRGCVATAGKANCCAICLSDTVGWNCLRVSACGHEFHAPCLTRWVVDYRATCPVCRAAVG